MEKNYFKPMIEFIFLNNDVLDVSVNDNLGSWKWGGGTIDE